MHQLSHLLILLTTFPDKYVEIIVWSSEEEMTKTNRFGDKISMCAQQPLHLAAELFVLGFLFLVSACSGQEQLAAQLADRSFSES